jgi:hypothetical protein
MKIGKVRVSVLHVELNLAGRRCEASAYFRDYVFKSIRQIDSCAVFVSGYRIQDRFTAAFHNAGDSDFRSAIVDIDGHVDRCEDRIVDLFIRRGKHLEECCAWIRIQSAHDSKQRIALFRRSTFINHRHDVAFPMMDRAGPSDDCGDLQSIQRSGSMTALLNIDGDDGLAVSLGWEAVKLTRTSIGTITMQKLASFNNPLRVAHEDSSGFNESALILAE